MRTTAIPGGLKLWIRHLKALQQVNDLTINNIPQKAARAVRLVSDVNMKFAVIGDFMLDEYVYGEVDRISPEAPVPVLKYEGEKFVPGGAGNVTANLEGLGLSVCAIGRTGCDSYGHALIELPVMKAADISMMIRDGSSIVKTRVLGGGRQQIVRIDREDFVSPREAQIDDILRNLKKLIESGLDAVIISDYGKGFCSPELCGKIITLCRGNGVKTFVDPKCSNWSKYAGAFLVTPNIRELSQAIGEEVHNEDDIIVSKGRQILKEYELENLLVTRSEKGATLITNSGFSHSRADSVEVFDVSGAGDTMIATVAAFSVAGLPLEECVDIANVASQVVIGKVGTCPITIEELEETILSKESLQKNKIAEDSCVAEILCKKWKKAGLKVVFTNGCFDILHAGHIDSLKRAKQLGDKLIVGLNSDESVRKLKGPDRPVNSERARAAVLSALEFVDLVVLFNEDTPVKLLSLLRPDVLAKGGDYSPEDVVGREFAGQVVILPLLDGYSTTGIIQKISSHD